MGNMELPEPRMNGANGERIDFIPRRAGAPVPVAICGMGLRLPGGIRSGEGLYDFLVNKKDARSYTPESRYNASGYHDQHSKHGTIITPYGYYLEDVDLTKFDLSMFNITSKEADRLDPQQRILLEVSREALESAGEVNWTKKTIGTYVGAFSDDWLSFQNKDTTDYGPYQLLGQADFTMANRLAYEFDVRGPSMTIKTACSSSGVCLYEAFNAIQAGDCNSAIVAGVSLIVSPGLTIGMTAQMALSPDGSCKSFDESANGFARGEGVSAIYVKRLDLAIKDGNPIRAVIRAAGSNVDGRTSGIAMPNAAAHEALIRQVYASAGLDFAETAMVECHGTGTKVGDPLETTAIANCFGKDGVYIGSIKPNLGHSEGNSALSSIIKATLSLENGTIIPNIKFNTPNPAIPWESGKLVVPTEPTAWPQGRAERISVNSFGISGSNFHLILDSAASFGVSSSTETARVSNGISPKSDTTTELLLFSANHAESLKTVSQGYQEYAEKHPDRHRDLAYTLAERREHLKIRSFSLVGAKDRPFEASPQVKPKGTANKIAFVFTGQGAQWANMGRQLILDYASFCQDIRAMDGVLQTLQERPEWSIEDILLNSKDKTLIGKAEYSQPICTALQVALVNLLATWGVHPSAVVGHSSGEIAAAYAAGALSLREAIIAAYYRGYICKVPQSSGGMAAVGFGRQQVEPYLVEGVTVACENSASSTTISGDLDALQVVLENIRKDHPTILARQLQVEMAYHSHHMKPLGDAYHAYIAKHLAPKAPAVTFFSSVQVSVLSESDKNSLGPQYWRDNLENPVLFHSAVTMLLQQAPDCSVHLEVGPHSGLAGPLRQMYKELSTKTEYVSTLSRGHSDTNSFLEAVGSLWSQGVKVTFPLGPGEQGRVLADLPSYPWHYDQSFWSETRVMKNWRFRKHLPHDILGTRSLEATDIEPLWRNQLTVRDVPWVKDHCVGNDIVFPAAGYICMAGEAAYQLSGIRPYTIRNVELKTALVLQDSDGAVVEMCTTLRPKPLTHTLDSDWFEFTIMSHDGTTWNKHVTGLVQSGRPLSARETKTERETEAYLRKVDSKRWYTIMSRVGLNYGPRFYGLTDISASVTESKSAATVRDYTGDTADGESQYPLHPATIDLVLQSLTVAAARGQYRNFDTLYLPTFIGELFVGNGTGKEIRLNTTAVGAKVTDGGSSHGVDTDGNVVFSMSGFKGTALANPVLDDGSPLKVMQLQWKADFEMLPAGDLMRPTFDTKPSLITLEKLFALCAMETITKLDGVRTSQAHLDIYRAWLRGKVDKLDPDTRAAFVDPVVRRQAMQEIADGMQGDEALPMVKAMLISCDRAEEIFQGSVDILELLLEDAVLTKVYDWMNVMWDYHDYFHLLGNNTPQLRVLEIGAGTGGLSNKLLTSLKSDFGERLYLRYTYTDISSGFFAQAQDRFKDYDAIEYRILDISRDPVGQGFGAGEYDLIVASNVLHATPWLDETLRNVRRLLTPSGRLFLQEMSPDCDFGSFVFGLFEGWWLGVPDGRTQGPVLEPEDWDKRLKKAGFKGCESVTVGNPPPYTGNANIVARPAVELAHSASVTLLSGPRRVHPLALEVEALFEAQGVAVTQCLWGQEVEPAEDEDVICFADLDDVPLLKDVSEADLARIISLVDTRQQSTILWLSGPAQIECHDPHQGQILGLARTFRAELGATFATLELEDAEGEGEGEGEGETESDSRKATAVFNVMRKIQHGSDERAKGEIDPDLEFAYSDGLVQLPRFHYCPLNEALGESVADKEPESRSIAIGHRGLLDTLHYESTTLPELGPDDVQLTQIATGMNMTDVVSALGIIKKSSAFSDTYNHLGLEGTAYVTKVGARVTNLAPGDHIVSIGVDSPAFATVIQRPASLCVKMPAGLSNEGGAGMPVVYVTVLRCLVDKARLERGQSVLIHSAAGGVGVAALHVAKWIGATVYATVGTPEKVEYLVREHGIPRERVFDSRNASFAGGLLAATGGRGVDCVLNSVSGELLHATWGCVASGGSMVEIGKRDMMGRGQLAMDLFEDNRTFFGVDIHKLCQVDHPTVARLMSLMVELYEQGQVQPLPSTVFSADEVEDAFRYMQRGEHIGKIVVSFPWEQPELLQVDNAVPAPSFSADKSYLLVGGTGGLGRSIASWMVGHGARHLVFVSRSTGKSETDKALFSELEAAGCTVQALPGDVGDLAAVQRVVGQIPADRPIGGVLQMAMVLRDIGVMDMDIEHWNGTMGPKISGTWNLHEAVPSDHLDFFVLFSSLCGTLGHYGQANYASTGSFLDSFVQFRHRLGQPASVIDIGAIEDVGYVVSAGVGDRMANVSGRLVREDEFLHSLHLTMLRSKSKSKSEASTASAARPSLKSALRTKGYVHRAQVTQSLEMDTPVMESGALWKWEPRLAIYRNIQKFAADTNAGQAADGIKQLMAALASASNADAASTLDQQSTWDFLAAEIGSRVASFLMRTDEEVDLTLTLAKAGVDSLVAIEVRNWWKQSFGVEVSVLELMNGGSLAQLGELAAKRLKAKVAARERES